MSKNKKSVFFGCATALVTPLKDGIIDFDALDGLIEFQIRGGADALVVCGTTGESATLSDMERREIISHSVEKVGRRVPVIAGTGCNNIKKAVELSRFASEVGADAVMSVTPYYNKASETGLIKSFVSIADSVQVPVIIYNVPSRTGLDIPISVYKKLAEHENICAVKEASGSIVTVERILEVCDGMLDVYSGNDDMILPIISVGGSGVVSVVSNIAPQMVHELCEASLACELERAATLQRRLLALVRACFCEVNPIPIKAATAMMGLCANELRLPLCELDAIKSAELRRVLMEYSML